MSPIRSRPAPSPRPTTSNQASLRSQEDRELRALLHKRLRFASLLGMLTFGCLALVTYRMNLKARWIADAAAAMLLAVPAGILWLKKELPLASLRRFELLVVGTAYVSLGAICIRRIDNLMSLPYLPKGLASELPAGAITYLFADGSIYSRFSFSTISNPIIIAWSGLAAVYGALIPNTWRRSVLFLATMVLSSVLCAAYAVFRYPILRPSAAMILYYTFFVVACFAAISMYGSHKISVLSSAVLTARQVGQYSLTQLLGKGGMGEVFLAQHRMLRRPCAVKLIRPEQAGDAGSLARFEREVQAMAKLTHSNTVEIYDYGRTEEGTFYYAMEYLPGLSAEALIRRYGAMTSGRAIHILRQVCGALGEAHAAGLIHRDIKPANLFVCERGRVFDVVKLLDFGLVQQLGGQEPTEGKKTGESHAVSEAGDQAARQAISEPSSANMKLTQAGHILGTPAYMSPEQARSGSADPRSDIYSVGAVGYFLLSGQPPFMRSTVAKMLQAHEKEMPTPLAARAAAVDEGLSAVIMKCLEKEPENRYQSVKELEQALSQCDSAALWKAEQAAQWWEQMKPVLAVDMAEISSPAATAESQLGTADATRDAAPNLSPDDVK